MPKRRVKRDCRSYRHRACVAMHEAAHAVAAVVFKRNLKSVTIVPTRWFSGSCRAEGSMRTRTQREDEVILCLAGILAEDGVTGTLFEHDLTSLYAFYLDSGYDDVVEAEEIMKRDRFTAESPRTIALGDRFGAFFREHWGAIEVLAGALLEARTLTAAEVRRVLRPSDNTC